MDIFTQHIARHQETKEETFTLAEYLEICKNDRMAYAHAAERLLKAIGDPEVVDTREDPRLSRIFLACSPILSVGCCIKSEQF